MTAGLSISRLIGVTVNLSPAAAQGFNFNSALIGGDSDVINTVERIRNYNSLAGVAADFPTTAPEYLAAVDFFGQNPQPENVLIGRWASAATHGQIIGGPLTVAQQQLSNFTGIANGSFKLSVDGGAGTDVLSINLTGAASLNAVAADIQTAVRLLGGAYTNVSVIWNGQQFIIKSGTTGPTSAVAALVAAASGTDLSALLHLTASTLQLLVPGVAAESAVSAVQAWDAATAQWYAMMIASPTLVDADHLAIAAFIEGSGAGTGNPHIYGLTTKEATALTSADSSSIGFQLKQLGYNRTFYQWSDTDPYAVASMIGRGVTVNFNLQNTVITLMWKQEPGVAPENFSATAATALDGNHYNYYAQFNNNTAIVVNGQMASGVFIDDVWDTDWQANRIQTDVWNQLLANNKIPQANAGTHLLLTTIENALAQGVVNGTIGEGLEWRFQGFGQLQTGDLLPKGFYVWAPDINTQAAGDRQARKSVPIQVAMNLAGAIHSAQIAVNVNR